MGREYNPDLYLNVIKCCCLDEDIENMPNKDNTVISDRGTTLSGGQKARLCLARVLYSEFDVFLLDDPLSSLDSKVSKKVFKRCLLKMLANKTRVIIMRNYDYLHYADKILIVDDNDYFFGNFNEFNQKYSTNDFNKFVISRNLKETNENIISNCNLIIDINIKKNIYKMPLKLTTYFNYFMLGFKSKFLIGFLILLFISNTYSVTYFYYYTTDYSNSSPATDKTLIYLAILFLVYTSFILPIMLLTHAIGISNKKLHENALNTVSKLPSSYFDENPSGVILNKLIKDTAVIDGILMPRIQEFSYVCFVQLSVITFVMIIQPFTILPLVILLLIYYFAIVHMLPICSSLRRLEIILTDPILSLSCSVLTGLSTIRSLKIQKYLKNMMKKSQLELFQGNLTSTYLCSFFVIILEYAVAVANIIIIVIILLTRGYFSSKLSLIAFAMILGLHGTSSLFFSILLRFDSCMISAQNLFELTETPKEDNSQRKDLQITNGKIKFMNLSVKYGEKNALEGLSCVIQPKSKIAIIGRTGAGKSTIIKAILRLVNPTSGTIFFDEQDYLEYSPKCIRKLISTNPQTSLIFYGSVRQNLDPFNEYSDSKIASILSMLKLNTKINENFDDENFGKDSNLSIGEKQLFSLARLLLKKSKIILIDEPTSSVDHITEAFIQDTINTEFYDCTILTISHREDIYKHYDHFMLIDNGVLIEFAPIKNMGLKDILKKYD